MRARAWLITAIAIAFPLAASAQAPLTNACQTQHGVCMTPAAPLGAPCACFTMAGERHPGRMIPPPAPLMAVSNPMPMSMACGTRFGVCQVPPAPVGAPCGCGADPGQVIFFR